MAICRNGATAPVPSRQRSSRKPNGHHAADHNEAIAGPLCAVQAQSNARKPSLQQSRAQGIEGRPPRFTDGVVECREPYCAWLSGEYEAHQVLNTTHQRRPVDAMHAVGAGRNAEDDDG
jgi:hypothetical protein